MEHSLFLIKPHAVSETEEILSVVIKNNFEIVKSKHCVGTVEQWSEHYEEHKEKDFFPSLVSDMAEKEIIIYILRKNNCVADLRQLIGSTNPVMARDGTLRKLFGVNTRNNAVHASDSLQSAKREETIWFGKD